MLKLGVIFRQISKQYHTGYAGKKALQRAEVEVVIASLVLEENVKRLNELTVSLSNVQM